MEENNLNTSNTTRYYKVEVTGRYGNYTAGLGTNIVYKEETIKKMKALASFNRLGLFSDADGLYFNEFNDLIDVRGVLENSMIISVYEATPISTDLDLTDADNFTIGKKVSDDYSSLSSISNPSVNYKKLKATEPSNTEIFQAYAEWDYSCTNFIIATDSAFNSENLYATNIELDEFIFVGGSYFGGYQIVDNFYYINDDEMLKLCNIRECNFNGVLNTPNPRLLDAWDDCITETFGDSIKDIEFTNILKGKALIKYEFEEIEDLSGRCFIWDLDNKNVYESRLVDSM